MVPLYSLFFIRQSISTSASSYILSYTFYSWLHVTPLPMALLHDWHSLWPMHHDSIMNILFSQFSLIAKRRKAPEQWISMGIW